MKRLLAVLIASAIGGCQCWDDAYQAYCADSGQSCTGDDGGAGGGTGGGGTGGGGTGGGGTGGGGTGGGTGGGGVGGGVGGGGGTDGGALPDSLGLTATTAPAGACVIGKVQSLAGLVAAPVPAPTPVRLNGSPGVHFFTDEACADGGGSVGDVVLPAGQNSVTFSFLVDQFGPVSLTAGTDAGFGLATAFVNATATLSLARSAPPTDMTCSARVAFQVIARGHMGSMVSTAQSVSLQLSSSLPEVFLSDSSGSCMAPVSTTTFPTGGASGLNFWVGGDAGPPPAEFSVQLSLPAVVPFVELPTDGGDTVYLGLGCKPRLETCVSTTECCPNKACFVGRCQ